MPLLPRPFRELFCEHYHCSAERFERAMFWRSLHRTSWPLAALIYWLKPEFFRVDFQTIRQLGLARRPDEFRREIWAFAYHVTSYGGWLRRWLRVRISGQRMLKLARVLLQDRGELANHE